MNAITMVIAVLWVLGTLVLIVDAVQKGPNASWGNVFGISLATAVMFAAVAFVLRGWGVHGWHQPLELAGRTAGVQLVVCADADLVIHHVRDRASRGFPQNLVRRDRLRRDLHGVVDDARIRHSLAGQGGVSDLNTVPDDVHEKIRAWNGVLGMDSTEIMALSFEHVIERIAEALHPQRSILFGSRARGDNRSDSNKDLLIVVPDGPIHHQLAADALRAAPRRGFAIDVVVLTESEVAQSMTERADFVWYAMQDGKVVYENSRQAVA
jgi:predicted nucleotidyltransferase